MTRSKATKKKGAGAKPGRKASGLRGLSPEAAQLVVTIAALDLAEQMARPDWKPSMQRGAEMCAADDALYTVRELERRRRNMTKVTGHAAPGIEQVWKQDLDVARMTSPDGEGGIKVEYVVRSGTDGLATRLTAAKFAPNLIQVAAMFAGDVERSRVGRLTSSYGEGIGGAQLDPAGAQAVRMERLTRSQEMLTRKERSALWAFVIFGLSWQDIGWFLVGERFGTAHAPQCNSAMLVVEGALERMAPFYLAFADRV